jgi:hypothetical protein
MKQNNLLGPQAYSPAAVDMAKTLQKMPQRELSEAISNYASKHADEVREFEKGPGLFAEPEPPTPPEQLFKESFDYAKQQSLGREKAAIEAKLKALQPGGIIQPPNGAPTKVKSVNPETGMVEY